MSEQRIDALEVRVARVEDQVTVLREGMVQVHEDLRSNNLMTQEIKRNTDSLVRAGEALTWLLKFFGWIGVIATGSAGAVYITEMVLR